MTDAEDLQTRAAALHQQLRDVYSIRGRDLATSIRRSRRHLPRALRRDGAQVAQTLDMLGHPKLETMVDFSATRAAHGRVTAHLDAVDVAYLRRGKWLSLAGVIAFQILVVAGAFVGWLIWSGHI